MDKAIKILICDDSIAVHESLSAYFKFEGMEYISVYDGKSALEKIKNEDFDIIVLDVMLPNISGIEVCREIRKTSNIPIIMLSAKGEELDRILGLEIGADDYMTKPFSPREVLTRIRTILRRSHPQELLKAKIIVIGNMKIDIDCYEVRFDDLKVELTAKEIELLIYLAKHINKVFTREQILKEIWGYDYYGDTRAVDTLIKRLRKKLPENGCSFEIKALYGLGYKLEVKK